MAPRLVALEVAGDPAAWRRAGFAFGDPPVTLMGAVAVSVVPGEPGLRGWAFDPDPGPIDGLPACAVPAPPEPSANGATHRNGTVQIDHVVVNTGDLPRTIAALEGVGLPCRRIREATVQGREIRQAFFRAGEVILEIVGTDLGTGGPAALWGIAVTVDDLDAACHSLGPEVVSEPRTAVQPGRRIASIRSSLGLGVGVALMTP